jgi:hypothetical protein
LEEFIMDKTVVGTADSKLFNVSEGKICVVKRSYFYNGEGWYELEDPETGETFGSPDVFWK